MTQTVVDVSRLKDFDSKAAIDSLATTFAGVFPGGTAVNQIIMTAKATNVAPTLSVGGTGSDTNISLVVAGKGTGSVALGGTTLANSTFSAGNLTSAVNRIVATGSIASGLASFTIVGTDTNPPLLVTAKGTGAVYLGGTTAANATAQVATTTSSVNQFILTSAATGSPAVMSVGGSGADANAALLITALASGTGSVYLGGGGTLTTASVEIGKIASSVNTIKLIPAATNNAPVIQVGGAGGDANRDLYVQGIGTGAARLKGGTGAVAAPSGYVGEFLGGNIKGTAATATVTMTSANPGVVTWTGHGFSSTVYQPVVFTTTGGLPTNITSGTVYYAVVIDANTFHVSTTIANAVAGTFIDTTSGAQSGTQTGTAGCAMASTTAINITGMSLPAGDWDVWAQVAWDANSSTTYTLASSSINTTSATLAGNIVVGGSQDDYLATTQTATNGLPSRNLPVCQINVSSATTIFLVTRATFATSTLGARGFLAARRRA